MAKVQGIKDLGMFQSLGQPNVRITPDRVQCGRYGLNIGDVEAVIQAAIGGQAVTQVYEGEKRFDLTVRWAPAYRKDLEAIREHHCRDARRRAGAARAARADRRGGGPVAHLSRGRPPLRAGEVLGARARSGVDDRRGAASGSPRR